MICWGGNDKRDSPETRNQDRHLASCRDTQIVTDWESGVWRGMIG